jgi:hypothetical protein
MITPKLLAIASNLLRVKYNPAGILSRPNAQWYVGDKTNRGSGFV